jgi:hypothetical protein
MSPENVEIVRQAEWTDNFDDFEFEVRPRGVGDSVVMLGETVGRINGSGALEAVGLLD